MHIIDLGLVDYCTALEEQQRVHARVVEGSLPATLILCRHYPVITAGRSSKPDSLLLPRHEYFERGIEVIDADRGGDVTYHAPGQLIAYPIYPMAAYGNDLHAYLRSLEEAVMETLKPYGIDAGRRKGLTGVWVENRKIASIGIAVRHWTSYHGISLIVKSKGLEEFSLIRPCGSDAVMTSIEAEAGRTVLFDDVAHYLIRSLSHDQCYAAAAR
ncbi:MAG TPA: lipoyl(octanoyl) transferase LipB [Candidatus Omnitrophota bacterium]|nr:lipoyl(octanoyl) transferase LipB [Candidatus Omnitrophota bacterium]HNQ51142.1 lipoyl(octanoyl) transferase LipB [Candidatus Omnitrophota bacterium]HQO38021.1 lipoyl(octanoyl) transferase LipB [Candidatus Omnitrophota bacterium]HQQ06011.1 lipoyl(octanoyl) transferase LipB [Candidatus Omnitrophota bacterium]